MIYKKYENNGFLATYNRPSTTTPRPNNYKRTGLERKWRSAKTR